MRKKLTTKTIDALPPAKGKRYEVRDALVPGLHIRVSATGAKVWYLATRVEGRMRRIKLGAYPVISLSDARQHAQGILRDIALDKYAESVPGSPEAPPPTLGGGLTARCPAHDDRRNSLSVSIGDKDRPIFHCHSGCSYEDIIDALSDASSSPSEASRKKPVRAKAKPSDGMKRAHFVGPNTPDPDFEEILGHKPEATYRYANPQDRTVGHVVRMKGKDGKRFYQITPWRDDEGTIRWLIEDFAKPRPLLPNWDKPKTTSRC